MIIPILLMIITLFIVNNPRKEDSENKTIIIKDNDYKSLAEKRIEDPLLPPERTHTNRLPINIRTQGELPSYQQVGFIYNNSNSIRLPLYGRPDFRGSNVWEYYVKDNTDNNNIKIPLDNNQELYNNDLVEIPSYNGDFITEIYEVDSPRYIQNLY